MSDYIVTVEEMEMVANLLHNMDYEQLKLVRQEIERLTIESFSKEFELDASSPAVKMFEDGAGNFKIEIDPKIQKMLDASMAEIKKIMSEPRFAENQWQDSLPIMNSLNAELVKHKFEEDSDAGSKSDPE